MEESTFNLNVSDTYTKYFHDLRKETRKFYTLHSGRGSVHCVQFDQSFDACKIVKNSELYCEPIECKILQFVQKQVWESWIFQQDRSQQNNRKMTTGWFKVRNVDILSWPAFYTDINLIENVWGWFQCKFLQAKASISHCQKTKRIYRCLIPENQYRLHQLFFTKTVFRSHWESRNEKKIILIN